MARIVRVLAWIVAFAGVLAVGSSAMLYVRIEAAPILLFTALGAASTWYGLHVGRRPSEATQRPIERLEALLES